MNFNARRRGLGGVVLRFNLGREFFLLKGGTGPCPCLGSYSVCIRPSERRNFNLAITRTEVFGGPVIDASFTNVERRVVSKIAKAVIPIKSPYRVTGGVCRLVRGGRLETGCSSGLTGRTGRAKGCLRSLLALF